MSTGSISSWGHTKAPPRDLGGAATVNGEVAQLVLLLAVLLPLVLLPLSEEPPLVEAPFPAESVGLAEPPSLLSGEEPEPVRAELFVVALPLSVR